MYKNKLNSLKSIMKKLINTIFVLLISIFLISCGGKLPGADAKKYPPDPKARVKQNLEEGRGFRLMNSINNNNGGGKFEFASSNELWRATLDVIDFMPLSSANYSGGIIVTDWYSENSNLDSIKITIRFLTNEVRSDAIDIKIFYKTCDANLNCSIIEKDGEINKELNRKILQLATKYSKENKDKNFKPYITSTPDRQKKNKKN